MFSLRDLPDDTIFEILKHSSIADAVRFSIVCQKTYTLSREKSYWLTVLETYRKHRPLVCPIRQDLSKLPSNTLRNLATKRISLDANWAKERPVVVGEVRTLTTDALSSIVSLVEGTDIIIIYSRTGSRIQCYDTLESKPFDLPGIDIGPYSNICLISQPCETEGKYTIGILSSSLDHLSNHYIYVISVLHENGKAVGLEKTFSHCLGSNFRCSDIFLEKNIVGVVQRSGENGAVIAFDMETKREFLAISIPRTDFDAQHAWYLYRRRLCYLSEGVSSLKTFDLSLEPFTSSSALKKEWPDSQISGWGESDGEINMDYENICLIPGLPEYGIHAVSLRHHFILGEEVGVFYPKTCIRFWPVSLTGDPESPLAFGDATHPGVVVDGRLIAPDTDGAPYMAFVGHSGFDTVLGVDDLDKRFIYLIRYNSETEPPSAHRLTIPERVDLGKVYNIAIDDFKGVVYMLLENGMLYSFSYV